MKSHDLHGFRTIPGGCLTGFLNYQQYYRPKLHGISKNMSNLVDFPNFQDENKRYLSETATGSHSLSPFSKVRLKGLTEQFHP